LKGKNCLITGATSGIGKVTAMELANQGAELVIIGRNPKKCESTVRFIKKKTRNDNIFYCVVDLSSQKEIRQFSNQFNKKYDHLDILINNAGAKIVKRQTSIDGYEMTFALNHLAYFLLTNLLLDLLNKSNGSRIVNVASDAHHGLVINFDDIQNEKNYIGKVAYGKSKLANILFTYELARKLQDTKITVNALHPGGVATNFCKNNGIFSWLKHIGAHVKAGNLKSPKKGAETTIYLATSSNVENTSGRYLFENREKKSSNFSYDQVAAKRLWEISMKMTGLQI